MNVSGAGLEQIVTWIGTTRIGRHTHIVIWYSPSEACFAVLLQEGIANLDELYRDAPGIRFAFGGDLVEGQLRPVFSDLIQYGSGDFLFAS
jgi:hypothetical protein